MRSSLRFYLVRAGSLALGVGFGAIAASTQARDAAWVAALPWRSPIEQAAIPVIVNAPPRAAAWDARTPTPEGVGTGRGVHLFDAYGEPIGQALALLARESDYLDSTPVVSGQAKADARATIAQHAPVAANLLIQQFSRLTPDDATGHAVLLTLLELVNDQPAAIAFLRELTMKPAALAAPPPRRAWPATDADTPSSPGPRPHVDSGGDVGTTRHCGEVDQSMLVRYLAMSQLFSAAKKGSAQARAVLLETLRSPHLDVKNMSVSLIYALTPNRRKAQTEMRLLLAPVDQYLIYIN